MFDGLSSLYDLEIYLKPYQCVKNMTNADLTKIIGW